VYSDEMRLEVRTPCKQKRIRQEKGQDLYMLPTYDKKRGNGVTMIVSGRISLEFKGPIWIWVKETAEEHQENAD